MKKSLLTSIVVLSLSAPAFASDIAAVYKAKCKSCHGEDGKAQTKQGRKEKIPDMSTPSWQEKHSDDEIFHVISEGSTENKKMKPFKTKLSEEEIRGLVGYIRQMKQGE